MELSLGFLLSKLFQGLTTNGGTMGFEMYMEFDMVCLNQAYRALFDLFADVVWVDVVIYFTPSCLMLFYCFSYKLAPRNVLNKRGNRKAW